MLSVSQLPAHSPMHTPLIDSFDTHTRPSDSAYLAWGRELNYGEGERSNKHGTDTVKRARQQRSQSKGQVGSCCRFAHPAVK